MTFEELREKALSLPHEPGVYLMMDATGTVIYVGKAKALKDRVSQYFHDPAGHDGKTRAMVAKIDRFDTIVVGSEFEALVLENSLIKRYEPHYNILLKDDKGYPYVRLSVQDPYPRFSLVGRMADDGARYFGPFGGRHDTQAIVDAIRAALRLPSCGKRFPRDQGKERPCLDLHMGLCDGWCRREVPRAGHQQAIEQAIGLLQGRFGQVERDLTAEMEAAAEALEFERAAALRDRLRAIGLLRKRQKVVSAVLADTDVIGLHQGPVRTAVAVLHFQDGSLTGREVTLLSVRDEGAEAVVSAFLVQHYGPRGVLPRQLLLPVELEDEAPIARLLSEQAGRRVELIAPRRGAKRDLIAMANENARIECERVTTRQERTSRALARLGEVLGLDGPPRRIEAYDISNTGASDIVAAMTVFEDGRPRRGATRCFRMRGLDGPDDYASMAQTIERRFRPDRPKGFAEPPDLLLIDGGAAHAGVAVRALAAQGLSIPTFGMVKDDRHRTRALAAPDGREIALVGDPSLFALVGQIQEETHRAAVGFHHRQHTKTATGSTLEKIPGVGPARRRALLKAFGSIRAIRAAGLAELEAVVPKDAARAVHDHFHPTGEKEETP